MNQQEEAYYSHSALSQTDIKALLESPQAFVALQKRKEEGGLFYTDETLFYKEKPGIIIGSAVDYHLSYGQEEFDELFTVLDEEKKPGAKPLSIAHMALDTLEIALEGVIDPGIAANMDTFKSAFVDIARDQGYRGNIKDPIKYWDSLKGEMQEYWAELVFSRGKQLLSQEEKMSIDATLVSLKTNPMTSKYFLFESTKDLDVSKQLTIHWHHDGVDLKSLLDMVLINHKKKLIAPIDYKVTHGSTLYFKSTFNMFRYDVQGAFYSDALNFWKQEHGFSEYKVLPFSYVVESYTHQGMPIVYDLSPESFHRGKYGDPADKVGYKKKGYLEGIQLYKWHRDNERWDFPKHVIDAKFRLPI